MGFLLASALHPLDPFPSITIWPTLPCSYCPLGVGGLCLGGEPSSRRCCVCREPCCSPLAPVSQALAWGGKSPGLASAALSEEAQPLSSSALQRSRVLTLPSQEQTLSLSAPAVLERAPGKCCFCPLRQTFGESKEGLLMVPTITEQETGDRSRRRAGKMRRLGDQIGGPFS